MKEALAIELVKDKIKEEINDNIFLNYEIEEESEMNGLVVTR